MSFFTTVLTTSCWTDAQQTTGICVAAFFMTRLPSKKAVTHTLYQWLDNVDMHMYAFDSYEHFH